MFRFQESMSLPTRRSSIMDQSKEMSHERARSELKTFTMAFGLWCQVTGISRRSYQSLLKVFSLLEDLETLTHLPRTIAIIKTYVKAQLSLLGLRRQEVAVAPQKMPTDGFKSAQRAIEDVYFFDPIHLLQTVLSPSFRAKIHVSWV